MLQKFFKFTFSFHPNFQYPPMQKGESPDVSCNTEKDRNTLTCLSTHINSLSLPHAEKGKHFTFVQKVPENTVPPQDQLPCGECGQTPLLQSMQKVIVSWLPKAAALHLLKVSFPLLHLGWGSRSVSSWKMSHPRPGWMASHGAKLEAGQSPGSALGSKVKKLIPPHLTQPPLLIRLLLVPFKCSFPLCCLTYIIWFGTKCHLATSLLAAHPSFKCLAWLQSWCQMSALYCD